ncbi:MAG: hypothetical protein ACFFG0_16225 [Candidatus Thorarchaeota archaeon]
MTHERKIKETAKVRIERLQKGRSGRSLCYIDQNVMFDFRSRNST